MRKRTFLYSLAFGILAGSAAIAALPASSNLNGLTVFPNPYKPQLSPVLTFGNLTADARIRIYKLTGEQVAELQSSDTGGAITWDTRNSSGDDVATGAYIYLVTNAAGEKKQGKLVIVK